MELRSVRKLDIDSFDKNMVQFTGIPMFPLETMLFDGQYFANVIGATFYRHSMSLPREIWFALASKFAGNLLKKMQWQGFLR